MSSPEFQQKPNTFFLVHIRFNSYMNGWEGKKYIYSFIQKCIKRKSGVDTKVKRDLVACFSMQKSPVSLSLKFCFAVISCNTFSNIFVYRLFIKLLFHFRVNFRCISTYVRKKCPSPFSPIHMLCTKCEKGVKIPTVLAHADSQVRPRKKLFCFLAQPHKIKIRK